MLRKTGEVLKGIDFIMTCNNCGSDIRDGSVFCTACGAHLATAAESADTQTPVPDTPPEPIPNPWAPPPQQAPPPAPIPPQQVYSPPPPFTPPPGVPYTPPVSQKKSKKGFVIGLIAGGLLLAAVSMLAGFMLARYIDNDNETNPGIGGLLPGFLNPDITDDPAPAPDAPAPDPDPAPATTPTPAPAAPTPAQAPFDRELIGVWEYDGGDYIWFFGVSDHIIFADNGDGTIGAFSSEFDDWAGCYIDTDGFLVVESAWGVDYTFIFIIIGNDLTLIDIDGDTNHFTRSEN